MKSFIKDLYFGNVEPQLRSSKNNRTYQQQMAVLTKNEAALSSSLNGENKRLFLEYVNAWSIVNGESDLDTFINGFRLGAQFTWDTFVSTDAPFEELLK